MTQSGDVLPWPHGTSARPCSVDPRPAGLWSSYWPALFLLGLGFAALPLDIPLAKIAKRQGFPPHLLQLVHAAEPYGHGTGVAFLLGAIFLLDPARRRLLPRIAAMSIGAGLASNLLKVFIHRSRPAHFNFAGGVFDTFKQWAPLATSAGGQSCPSSHAATAVGMSLALAWVYPRGRWLFMSMATLVAVHRVVNMAHFASDVCWGAAIGWLMGAIAFHGIGNCRAYDRWEEGGTLLSAESTPAAEPATPARRKAA